MQHGSRKGCSGVTIKLLEFTFGDWSNAETASLGAPTTSGVQGQGPRNFFDLAAYF